MSEELERYKIAIETRNFEIQLFWHRSLFFAAFVSAIFVGYSTITANDFTKVILATLGFLITLAWSLANRGSKYWYESWESKINDLEENSQQPLFLPWKSPQEKFFLYRSRLFSVSKIAIYVTDLIFLSWLSIFIKETFEYFNLLSASKDHSCFLFSIFLIFILLALAALFWGTRTTVPDSVKKEWVN